MKSADERADKFMAKSCRNQKSRAKRRATRIHVAAAFEQQVEIDSRTQGILTGERVMTVDYIKYYIFARQVGKLLRKSPWRDIPVGERSKLLTKFQSWGCPRPILRRILDDLFSVTLEDHPTEAAPTGPNAA